MKRGEAVDGVDGTVAPMAVSMIRDATRGPAGPPLADASQALLVEQNALLREMLAAMSPARAPPHEPTAPEAEELRNVAAALQETNQLLRQLVAEKKDKEAR